MQSYNLKLKIIFITILFCGIFGVVENSKAFITYTVCSVDCSSTTIQGVFNNNELGADDVVEVRADTPGGTKSYFETVTPEVTDDGVSEHPVIFRVRSGDTIIIDGQDTRDNGINLSNVAYFTVNGFIFSNHTGAAIYNKCNRPDNLCADLTVKNATINISLTNGKTGFFNQGISFHGNRKPDFQTKNVVIDNCKIQTGEGDLYEQTDGIALYYVDTAIIKNNSINLRNTNSCNFTVAGSNADCIACGAGDVSTCIYQHIDGIQTGTVKNPTIYNNIITLWRNHNAGGQGIYVEGNSDPGEGVDLGTWLLYNNVLFADGWESRGMSLAEKNDTSIQKVYNNTMVETYASASSVPYALDGDNVFFQNNIGVTARNTLADNLVASFSSTVQAPSQINNNIYYNSGGGPVAIGNVAKSWNQWQADGYDTLGINTDPLLDGEYKLAASSPAKYAGIDLSSIFTTDILGTPRLTGAWSMGAYEYISNIDVTPPSAPSGLQVS